MFTASTLQEAIAVTADPHPDTIILDMILYQKMLHFEEPFMVGLSIDFLSSKKRKQAAPASRNLHGLKNDDAYLCYPRNLGGFHAFTLPKHCPKRTPAARRKIASGGGRFFKNYLLNITFSLWNIFVRSHTNRMI